MLDVRELAVSFADARSALSAVNLRVAAGELVALSGEPGSGKSTLVGCVAGDFDPTHGSIRVDGRLRDASGGADRDVAVVWQDLVLCDALDVAANLMLGREHQMRSSARFYAAAAQELRELRIPIPDVTVPVMRLSLWQRRLLALAMALGRGPKVLVVDELTAALDASATATVERLLREARASGVAVLLVTRDIEQMFRIADRVVVLAHGSVAAEFDPEISHRDDIAALLGEEAAIAHREAQALRRSQDLQRQFLSRLSHELRTPLTAIHGYATSLAAPDVTWDAASEQRFLARIAAESGRLGRLVGDLLDFSAIESGVMRLAPDWCELELVIRAAASLLPQAWSSAVSVSCGPGASTVWADHDRLEQVFLNLLVNAFRHNEESVKVAVRAFLTGTEQLVITVRDDGHGFPPELARDPFDSGRRPRSSTAGAGLGLGIAKGIVEAHGGTIELRDAAPGAEFRITLPIEGTGQTRRDTPPVDTLQSHA